MKRAVLASKGLCVGMGVLVEWGKEGWIDGSDTGGRARVKVNKGRAKQSGLAS